MNRKLLRSAPAIYTDPNRPRNSFWLSSSAPQSADACPEWPRSCPAPHSQGHIYTSWFLSSCKCLQNTKTRAPPAKAVAYLMLSNCPWLLRYRAKSIIYSSCLGLYTYLWYRQAETSCRTSYCSGLVNDYFSIS